MEQIPHTALKRPFVLQRDSYWLDAWETEIKRLDERNLLVIEQETCPELFDPDKPIKSKAAF